MPLILQRQVNSRKRRNRLVSQGFFALINQVLIENRKFESAMKEPEDMDLESIEVEHSPVCRPDSDCWDVKLHFFFPARQVQTVRKVYRFTVDVSDVVPVTVGPVRSWFVR
jgi:PatG C-terminal